MKKKFWLYLKADHPEGTLLTRRLFYWRMVLFPLHFFYCWMGNKEGYQFERDAWIVNGVAFDPNYISKNDSFVIFKRLQK